MKILHLIDHMGLGGAQNLILDLVETKSAEIDAAVWSLSDQVLPSVTERLEAAGVPFRTLGMSRLNPLGLLKVRSLLANEKPHLIHTHLQYSSTLGILAAITLRKHCPIIVNHIHNDPFLHYAIWQRLGSRLLAPFVAVQITSSMSLRKRVKQALGKRVYRMEAIIPGLNLNRFNPARNDPSRIKYLRGGHKRVVGTVGRLTKQKALHVLIEAVPRLLHEEPATRILIAGDGPLRRPLERQAEQLNVSHAVKFIGYQSDMIPVYQAMDVFVLPSQHEGFGLVLIEAMALNVPVIGACVTGIVDAVQDGITGLLVPFGDPAALSSAILKIFERPKLKRTLISTAFEFVQRTCAREFMTAGIESLYFDLEKRNK